jgi:aminopeptidase N
MHIRNSLSLCVRTLFIFAGLFASATLTVAAPPALSLEQTQGSGLPPTQYLASRNYDTHHIKLNLSFDWEREQARGTATISLTPMTSDVRRVEFDATNMTINSIKLTSGKTLPFEMDSQHEKLRVTLDRSYQPKEEIVIVIDYHTNGVSTERGLYGEFRRGLVFIKPTPDDPSRPRQIWSQGEPEYNHYWFPCFDHPDDFFTSEVYATVEPPLRVISNGNLLGTRQNPGGTRTFHWKMDVPHASYLTSIIVGDYTPIIGAYAGIPVITDVYPNEVEEGKISGKRLLEMVRFFSATTGVKYPYAKYEQTMVRDFDGAMENITATTMTDQAIHDARAELDQTSDDLMSHELAHQWFGDYVTCRSWSDVWLNEGFATYFQAIWDEHNLGRDDFLYLDVKADQDAYYKAWSKGNRRPIVTKNYSSPAAMFDTYTYQRGAAVLHMLRRVLGEDRWWRSLKHYLTKYAHQPVETDQLRIAIEETTGSPMDWFFDEWVYKMGHPIFRIRQSFSPSTHTLSLVVRQEQQPDPESSYPQAAFFRTPVEIEIGTASGARLERVWIEPKEEQTFTFAADSEPLLVNFDYGGTLLKVLKFDKSTEQLVYQLLHDQDVIGRRSALEQLSDRMKSESTPTVERQQITTATIEALRNDSFWGIRNEAAAALDGVIDQAARTALVVATKDQQAKVRMRAITSLSSVVDQMLASTYRGLLSDPSYSVVRAAANALGKTKSSIAYDALVQLLEIPSWHDSVRGAALGGLIKLEDDRGIEAALRYSDKRYVSQVRQAAVVLLAIAGKNNERAFTRIDSVLQGAIVERDLPLAGEAAAALAMQGDPRGIDALENARQKVRDPHFQDYLQHLKQRMQKSVLPKSPVAPGQAPY